MVDSFFPNVGFAGVFSGQLPCRSPRGRGEGEGEG